MSDFLVLPFELIDIILRRPELASAARLVCIAFSDYHDDWEALMDEFYAQIRRSPFHRIKTRDDVIKYPAPSRKDLSWHNKSPLAIPYTFEYTTKSCILDEFSRCNTNVVVLDELCALSRFSRHCINRLHPRYCEPLDYIYPLELLTSWRRSVYSLVGYKKYHRSFENLYLLGDRDDELLSDAIHVLIDYVYYSSRKGDFDEFIELVRNLPKIETTLINLIKDRQLIMCRFEEYPEWWSEMVDSFIVVGDVLGLSAILDSTFDFVAISRFLKN